MSNRYYFGPHEPPMTPDKYYKRMYDVPTTTSPPTPSCQESALCPQYLQMSDHITLGGSTMLSALQHMVGVPFVKSSQLSTKIAAWEQNRNLVASINNNQNQVVHTNNCATTKDTLISLGDDTYFEVLFNGTHWNIENDIHEGALTLSDPHPEVFRDLLCWLREGKNEGDLALLKKHQPTTFVALLEEAQYFNSQVTDFSHFEFIEFSEESAPFYWELHRYCMAQRLPVALDQMTCIELKQLLTWLRKYYYTDYDNNTTTQGSELYKKVYKRILLGDYEPTKVPPLEEPERTKVPRRNASARFGPQFVPQFYTINPNSQPRPE
eukprot:TRINITY_DN32860_c0_g1_i1.p1 TRINITY_DN32860_c0_g1~~TRINITY_DN32860_c0_g1_i1.p1  ORF type:complete len:323 (+),score=30.88 TRINITY_DN32860_c0_g1_i1:50-1018(+)